MPLLKLWKSFRGESNQSVQVSPGNAADQQREADQPRPARTKTGNGFGLFGGGPHGPLRKQLKSLRVTTVLEVGVGDGSRTVAISQALAKNNASVRHLAIDSFELDGHIRLVAFHQKLRAEGIHPQVFPGQITEGLAQVAHTVGAIDLILIDAPAEAWQTPAAIGLLARLSHGSTVVLYAEEEAWNRYPVTESLGRRAA